MKRVAVVILFHALGACQVESEVGSNAIVVPDARPDALLPPECNDGDDNDGDGHTDFPFDPGCQESGDRDESSPPLEPICFNQIDDDTDGLIDFPFDPGCPSASNSSEIDPPSPPECADQIDNDGDGEIDYPADTGCSSAGDLREATIAS